MNDLAPGPSVSIDAKIFEKYQHVYNQFKERSVSCKKHRDNSPYVTCECGFVTKAYLLPSHKKSGRHRRILEVLEASKNGAPPPATTIANKHTSITEDAKTQQEAPNQL